MPVVICQLWIDTRHEEQTAIHVLTSCSHVDEYLRDQASYLLSVGNEKI